VDATCGLIHRMDIAGNKGEKYSQIMNTVSELHKGLDDGIEEIS
jgi:hypothetical protein